MLKIFRHYIPKSMLVMGLCETAILLLSMALAILIIYSFFSNSPVIVSTTSELYVPVVSFTLIMQLTMISMGLYQRDLPGNSAALSLRILLSFILGIVLIELLSFLMPSRFFTLDIRLLAAGCAFGGIYASRLLFHRNSETISGRSRVLVLGTGKNAAQLENHFTQSRAFGRGLLSSSDIEIIGYFPTGDDDAAVQLNESRITRPGLKSLCEYAKANGVREIVVAMDDRRKKIPVDDLIDCRMKGIHIIDMAGFLERESGCIVLESFQPGFFFYSDGFMQALRHRTKRLLDICVSLCLLIITSPVSLLTALAICYESGGRGPVIYRQERIGLYGNSFTLFKFRSMVIDAEKDGVAVWAGKNDDRVTGVGRFIRKTRIDELPQLVNVLKGDMSLVGPRPERPQIVREMAAKIPFFTLRHYAQPGITGWAQICYPYGACIEDARQKLQFDLYYIKNYSVFLDILILLQTVAVVLWGKGAR